MYAWQVSSCYHLHYSNKQSLSYNSLFSIDISISQQNQELDWISFLIYYAEDDLHQSRATKPAGVTMAYGT